MMEEMRQLARNIANWEDWKLTEEDRVMIVNSLWHRAKQLEKNDKGER